MQYPEKQCHSLSGPAHQHANVCYLKFEHAVFCSFSTAQRVSSIVQGMRGKDAKTDWAAEFTWQSPMSFMSASPAKPLWLCTAAFSLKTTFAPASLSWGPLVDLYTLVLSINASVCTRCLYHSCYVCCSNYKASQEVHCLKMLHCRPSRSIP